jgi:hypothetical protein
MNGVSFNPESSVKILSELHRINQDILKYLNSLKKAKEYNEFFNENVFYIHKSFENPLTDQEKVVYVSLLCSTDNPRIKYSVDSNFMLNVWDDVTKPSLESTSLISENKPLVKYLMKKHGGILV